VDVTADRASLGPLRTPTRGRHAFSRLSGRPRPADDGATIDEYLQHIAERELHAGVLAHRAKGGTAIIMNPHTGEILAMANEPTFNPNAYRDAPEGDRRNRAVQDLYEPGSTFKVVTASAAIQEKVMPIDTWIDTNPGFIRIGNSKVDEYRGKNYGVLSFKDDRPLEQHRCDRLASRSASNGSAATYRSRFRHRVARSSRRKRHV
jgi:cell division protein FtsI/penicillin-binding protein 2